MCIRDIVLEGDDRFFSQIGLLCHRVNELIDAMVDVYGLLAKHVDYREPRCSE